MRGDTSNNTTTTTTTTTQGIPGEPRGLTRSVAAAGRNGNSVATQSMNLSMRAMRLKLSGKSSTPDMSTRKQVGDTEAMLEGGSGGGGGGGAGERPWWKNVGMEEGM
jgi:pyruvate dehydrogenase kinase 2/3/4